MPAKKKSSAKKKAPAKKRAPAKKKAATKKKVAASETLMRKRSPHGFFSTPTHRERSIFAPLHSGSIFVTTGDRGRTQRRHVAGVASAQVIAAQVGVSRKEFKAYAKKVGSWSRTSVHKRFK